MLAIIIAALSTSAAIMVSARSSRLDRLRPVTVSPKQRKLSIITYLPAALSGLVLLPISVPLGYSVAVIAIALQVVVMGGLAQRKKIRLAADISHACRTISGQLNLGRMPTDALRVASQTAPILTKALAEADLGADVSDSIQQLGRNHPGAEALIDLGRAWKLSAGSGMSMKSTIQQVVKQISRQQMTQRELTAELTPARASAVLLAFLPAVGIAMGYGLGSNPLQFLNSAPIGWICSFLAASFIATGLLWSDRIARLT